MTKFSKGDENLGRRQFKADVFFKEIGYVLEAATKRVLWKKVF